MNKSPKILIKFPSRGRPERFKSSFEKYLNFLSGNYGFYFVFSFDENDLTMNNNDMISYLEKYNHISEYHFGKNTNKVEAINANMENKTFDILILASDDMIPVVKNYDEVIVSNFQKSGFDYDCMLHFHNIKFCNELDINCVMGYDYYKRFNYIYHPSYKSIFADNEYTEVSKILGKNVFIHGVEPFYHDWRGGDETEIKNFKYNREDWEVWENRKKNNYDLNL